MKIFFVTHNPNKVREFKQILEPGIKVEQVNIDYPELRSDYPEEIVKLAVKQLADKLNKAVVAEDSGLFIKSLNGFPGTSSAYIHKRIGLKGILSLMKGMKNRGCMYISAVAYCEPGKKPLAFLGSEKGKIALSIKGKHGFGHDPIFVPEGSEHTYGEIENVEEVKRFRRIAVLKLREYLLRTSSIK
ncbi:RdgB/HAM1 family non-canonical purine NTP pyrophosphatase [Candidatus Woesearchaeota archaeon]|nr:RdgB/HAM1 family non-canonical purine NTP pyrophosphatase [Candidatus Woesearchaeota archaeon]